MEGIVRDLNRMMNILIHKPSRMVFKERLMELSLHLVSTKKVNRYFAKRNENNNAREMKPLNIEKLVFKNKLPASNFRNQLRGNEEELANSHYLGNAGMPGQIQHNIVRKIFEHLGL